MDFRTEVNIPQSGNKIDYRSNILCMGSCFTENIGDIMKDLHFRIDVNPFGVNYNPSSVARNLWTLMKGKQYSPEELESSGDKWFSFDHHSQFSHPDRDVCLQNINENITKVHGHLQDTRFLLLTWGTAWLYVNKKTANVVSNCHKLPAENFSRHLLSVSQIEETYTKLFASLRKEIPELNIILTVSPVRHLKDGPQLNSVSKSTLILAAHKLSEMFSYCDYFPAWELAMDDLRDYRFYADDLVHPNNQMVRYIWNKFSKAWLDEESKGIIQEVRKLVNARKHRPFDPASEKHRDFCRKQLEAIHKLTNKHSCLDLSDLKDYFNESLKKT